MKFHVPRTALSEPDDGELAWRVVAPFWDCLDEEDPREVRTLTPGQLAVWTVMWVEREVLNGGFWQYFSNPMSCLALEACAGFLRIGAKRYHRVMLDALRVFPRGTPPRDRAARQRGLDAATKRERRERFAAVDKRFFHLCDSDDLYAYLARYIRDNPDYFAKPEPATGSSNRPHESRKRPRGSANLHT